MKLSELAKELGYKTPELKVLVERRKISLPESDVLTAQLLALVRARIPPASRLSGEDLNAVRFVQEKLTSEKQAKAEEKQKKEEAKRIKEEEKAKKESEKAARKVAREQKAQEKEAKKTGKAAPGVAAKTVEPGGPKKKVKEIDLSPTARLRPPEVPPPVDEGPEPASLKSAPRVRHKPVIELQDKPEVRVMRPFDVDRYTREGDRSKVKAPTPRVAKGVKREKETPAVKESPPARGKEVSPSRSRRHTGAGRQLMAPTPSAQARPKPIDMTKRKLSVKVPISVRDFSALAGVKVKDVLRKLHDDGLMATVDTPLEEEQVVLLGLELNRDIELVKSQTVEQKLMKVQKEAAKKGKDVRAPVVVFMGHVDHGKTTLMDKIRQANVAAKEFGGITQHIGAYRVKTADGRWIAFLDTPGHEAFTKMRARGANVTDIAVIVVAADEGVMPQTEEAISHAKEAGVTIMTAITKVDKKDINLNRVKQQLSKIGLIPEEYGGQTISVEVSGITGQGIPKLLEMILLQAELLELRADAVAAPNGTVLEARMTEGKGPVATLLVQNGTLRKGDSILVGDVCGRVRGLFDEHGRPVDHAGPSDPVEVMGLEEVPEAGNKFIGVKDVNQAKDILRTREAGRKEATQVPARKHVSLETLFKRIEGGIKEVKLILKADVKGSIEALEGTLAKLSKPDVVGLKVIHSAVGAVAESDVILADASDAIVVGFNVTIDDRSQELAKEKGIQIKTYNIIYELLDDVKAAMEGLLEPDKVEEVIGHCEVKQVFKISKLGQIAGCAVRDGKIERTSLIRVLRGNKVLHTGKLESLKRFKDDVREVAQGYECGLRVAGFDQVQAGDVLEVYQVKEVSRKLFQRQA